MDNDKIEVVVIEADVSKASDIERIVATTLDQFKGTLDVLVNNASTIGPSPMPYLLDYPLEDFQDVLDTNLIGPFLLIKNSLPAMIESGGSIINVTSDAGQVAIRVGALTGFQNLASKACRKPGHRSWKRAACE